MFFGSGAKFIRSGEFAIDEAIAANTTVTIDVALPAADFTKALIFLGTPWSGTSTTHYGKHVEVIATRTSADAHSIGFGQTSRGMGLYTITDMRPAAYWLGRDTVLSETGFNKVPGGVRLEGAYISGSNLKLTFKNIAPATAGSVYCRGRWMAWKEAASRPASGGNRRSSGSYAQKRGLANVDQLITTGATHTASIALGSSIYNLGLVSVLGRTDVHQFAQRARALCMVTQTQDDTYASSMRTNVTEIKDYYGNPYWFPEWDRRLYKRATESVLSGDGVYNRQTPQETQGVQLVSAHINGSNLDVSWKNNYPSSLRVRADVEYIVVRT